MKTITQLLVETFHEEEHSCGNCHFFGISPFGKFCELKNKVIEAHGKQNLDKWLRFSEDKNDCKYFKKYS